MAKFDYGRRNEGACCSSLVAPSRGSAFLLVAFMSATVICIHCHLSIS